MTMATRRTILRRAGLASLAGLTLPAVAQRAAAAPTTAPVHNVLDHGAAGDGTTDDTAAFQSAVDAIAAAGRGTLLVPPHTYNLASEDAGTCVILHADNMTVRADGATFLRPTEFARGMFIVNTRSGEVPDYGAGIRNLRWYGGRFLGDISARNYICAFGLHNVANCRFEGITFENCQAGASHMFDMVGADDVTIERCRFLGQETRGETDNVAEAVQIGASYKGGLTGGHENVGFSGNMTRGVTIRDCEFLPWAGQAGPTPFGHHGGVEGKHHHDLRFLGNVVQDPRTSLIPADKPTEAAFHGVLHLSDAHDVRIVGNVFRQTRPNTTRVVTVSGFDSGVLAGADPDKPDRGAFAPQAPADIVIQGNVIEGFSVRPDYEAICVVGLDGTAAPGVLVSGNTITNGAMSDDAAPALRLGNLRAPSVTGNRITDHPVGISLDDGTTAGAMVTDNLITNTTSSVLPAAITIDPGVTDSTISRNVVNGYTKAVAGEAGEGTDTSGNVVRP